MKQLRALAALLIAILLGVLAAPAARAQEPSADSRAGLVVVKPEGEVTSACVELGAAEISGWELLTRAGLAVQAEQAAMGMTVCSLEGTGCDFPAESCFCQCQSSPCVYWSYWEQDAAGAWVYSSAGASNTKVRSGDVQAWVWGEGTSGKAPEPPALNFEQICAAPVAEAALSSELPSQEIAAGEGSSAGEAAQAEAIDWKTPLAMGLVVLLPLAAFAIFGRRRRAA